MSFADGFKQGFGMMGAVQDRQLYKERLDEQARQGDLDRKATSDYRAEQNRLAGERNITAQSEADSQAEYRERQADNQAELNRIRGVEATNKTAQLGLDKTRIDADASLKSSQGDYYNAQTSSLSDGLKVKQERRGQRETNSAAALQVQSFVDLAEQVRTGEVAYDADTQARLSEMAEATRGTLMDLNYVTQPNVQFQVGRFQQVLELVADKKGEGVDESAISAIKDTFNVMFHSNHMAGVGEAVTEATHKHAGSFADKGFVVVGKQVSGVKMNGNSLELTVDVLIENPETGASHVYEAPMTVGREASGDKAFMSIEEAAQAASGFYQYAKSMAPYRGILNEINARGYDLTEGRKDGDFMQLVSDDIKAAEIDGARNPELSSPIKGMTMGEFAANKGLMRSHYSSNRVGNYQPVEAALAGDATYNLISKAPMLEGLERYNEGKPLSRAKVLEAAQFISEKTDPNTMKTSFVIDDKDEWNQFKNTFRSASNNRGAGKYLTPSEQQAHTGSGKYFNAVD